MGKKINLSPLEKETIINFNEGEDLVEIYTASRRVMTKLDKLCKSHPKSYWVISGDGASKTYGCASEGLISFRSGSKKGSRNLTDEQRKAAGERLMKARNLKT